MFILVWNLVESYRLHNGLKISVGIILPNFSVLLRKSLTLEEDQFKIAGFQANPLPGLAYQPC